MANGAPMQAAMLLRCGLCQLVCFPTSSHCVNHAVWHAACTDVLQRARCSTCADLPISLCPPPPPCRRHAGQCPCVSRGAAGLRVRQHLPAHGCRLPRHLVEGLGGGRARCGERCLMRHRPGMPCHLCGPTQLFARLCCPVPGVYLSANHTRHCCGVPVCQLCCVCGSSALW